MSEDTPGSPKTKRRAEPTARALIEEILLQLGELSLPLLYKNTVLATRTRQFQLDAETRGGRVEILHTLLGIELKIGRRRLICPDLATARYLSVFARVGIDRIAVPYDISQISRIADEMESAWQRMLLLIDYRTVNRTERLRARVRRLLLQQTRAEIKKLGAGTRIPKFNQNTKQRRPRA